MILLVKDKETNEIVSSYECEDYDIKGNRVGDILLDGNVYLEEEIPINQEEAQDEQ